MVGVPKTREKANRLGSAAYFSGVPCKYGHIDKRYTNTGICYECKRLQVQRDYANHTKRVKIAVAKYRLSNSGKVSATNRRWVKRNRVKSNGIKKAWKIRNQERYRAAEAKRNRDRRCNDPFWRLSKNTGKSIWDGLKKKKGHRHWETLVGFTLEQLVAHLESRFKRGMNWNNYGKFWELDHVKPVSLCISFEEAWALTNLQPLECNKNRSKCNRYIG